MLDNFEAPVTVTLVARAIRNAIRANRFARIISQLKPLFLQRVRPIRANHSNSDSRESGDSRESCESIRANHATKTVTPQQKI